MIETLKTVNLRQSCLVACRQLGQEALGQEAREIKVKSNAKLIMQDDFIKELCYDDLFLQIECKLETSYTSWTNDLDECNSQVYKSQENLTNSTLQVVRNYECTAQKCLALGEIVLLVLKQNDPPDKCLMKVSNVENVLSRS